MKVKSLMKFRDHSLPYSLKTTYMATAPKLFMGAGTTLIQRCAQKRWNWSGRWKRELGLLCAYYRSGMRTRKPKENILDTLQKCVDDKKSVIVFSLNGVVFVRKYDGSRESLTSLRYVQKLGISYYVAQNGYVKEFLPEKTIKVLNQKMHQTSSLPDKVEVEKKPEHVKIFEAGMYRPSRKRYGSKPSTEGANRIVTY